ncbi:molybdopterin converting factor subunit 1 [Evansella cellulosilytica]|uniref:Molybdopterin synthase sulfur carrier subunit n=1 Tax=Evansella cellulosilytica (strain ATCC 21833 / DSM 2522 / FERM P-1141 / JCM 9156 / N-4) TaxID=649639 RepID=E6TXX8_EVAC2|nr:molybdopterin converting factor subunit 1 [Evansella cellulosilytica]ADU31191.1 molybdopterin converting factor, subunit 1 [Evansella cellulosilytica DSM 2522]
MIRVLLFADLEEKAGEREITITNEQELTVLEIKDYLLEKYPKLSSIHSAMPAVNEEYADDSLRVKNNDTVAFIPPVSGG